MICMSHSLAIDHNLSVSWTMIKLISRAPFSPDGLWTLVVRTRVLTGDVKVWRNGSIPRYSFPPLRMHVSPRGWIDQHCSGTCIQQLSYLSTRWSVTTFFFVSIITIYIVAHRTLSTSKGGSQFKEPGKYTCISYVSRNDSLMKLNAWKRPQWMAWVGVSYTQHFLLSWLGWLTVPGIQLKAELKI